MNKKIVIGSALVLIAAAGIGGYFWRQSTKATERRAEEAEVRSLAENFGRALKTVSLLAVKEAAAKDIQEKYRDFAAQELLKKWMEKPEAAIGRTVSSPWPERIEVEAMDKQERGGYIVEGSLIEMTSAEMANGGIAAKRYVMLTVEKKDGRWLITDASLGPYDERKNAWKPFTDKRKGISFEYPDPLVISASNPTPTLYVQTHEWPPKAETAKEPFSCRAELHTVESRAYCVKAAVGAAAGSTYTEYAYTSGRQGENKTITFRFTLRYPNCGNYDEKRRAECEEETGIFDLDSLVDRMAQSAKLK